MTVPDARTRTRGARANQVRPILGTIFWCLSLPSVTAGAAGESSLLVKPPGQSVENFARATVPAGMTLGHPVVTGTVGPFRDASVVLVQPAAYRDFSGWVLVPEAGGYRRWPLPEAPQPISTELRSVFFANADQDPEPELFILARHISGVGRYPANVRPFCNTYPYDWNGEAFVYLEDLAARLNRCTAAGVRRQLRTGPARPLGR